MPDFKVMHFSTIRQEWLEPRTSDCGPTELGMHDLTDRDKPRCSAGKNPSRWQSTPGDSCSLPGLSVTGKDCPQVAVGKTERQQQQSLQWLIVADLLAFRQDFGYFS